jgi:hypothetical protein
VLVAPVVQFELPGNVPLPPPAPLLTSVVFSVHADVPSAYGLLLRELLYDESQQNRWWQSVYG